MKAKKKRTGEWVQSMDGTKFVCDACGAKVLAIGKKPMKCPVCKAEMKNGEN